MIIVHVPTEAGNKMVNDPNGMQTLENYLKKIKAEATYFAEDKGERTFYIVADIASADKLPSIAEPMFQGLNAKVEVHPAMNLDDLKRAIQNLV